MITELFIAISLWCAGPPSGLAQTHLYECKVRMIKCMDKAKRKYEKPYASRTTYIEDIHACFIDELKLSE